MSDPTLRLIGNTRLHLVGDPVDPTWTGGGTHHSLCGMVTDHPTDFLPSLPLCQVCAEVAARPGRQRKNTP